MTYDEYKMHEASNRSDYENGLITLAEFASRMAEICLLLFTENPD